MSSKLSAKLNEEIYQKLLSWILHGNDPESIKSEWFLQDFYRGIHLTLLEMKEADMPFVLDEVFSLSKESLQKIGYSGKAIIYDDIETIYSNFDDFTNIKALIKKIKDEYIKSIETAHIFEELISVHSSLDNIPVPKLKDIRDRIDRNIQELEAEECVSIMPVVMQRYEEETADREVEGIKRTLGFPILEQRIVKAGAPKNMMLLFGESGSGKSLFTQAIVNQIINNPRKIPVAYFSLEMSLTDVMDRFLSFREGISIDDLERSDKPDRIKGIIDRGKERMRKMDHFHLYDPPGMSSSDLDRYLTTSKEKWADLGILPPDGYNVAVIDLVTMMADFADKSPQKAEQAVDRLHYLFRKHNTFPLIVAQANENQFRRERRFKKPEDVKYFRLAKEDIKLGSALHERCRVVMSIIRRRALLLDNFKEDSELWMAQRDLIEASTIKNNNGALFYTNFAFEYDPAYKIFPYDPETDKKEGEEK